MRYRKIKFKNIAIDSKKVKKGDLFVAIKGERFDGHDFVEEAFKRGAAGAIVENEKFKMKNYPECRNILRITSGSRRKSKDDKVHSGQFKIKNIIRVNDTKKELSKLAATFYDYPSRKLKTIGITGTNGKTTISFLLDKIFTDAGYKTGLVGTIFYKIGNRTFRADRTTPDALRLNYFLGQMVRAKTDYAVLEVSSHALQQERVKDIFLDIAIFTNLTREHLDYHKKMRNYFEAKAKIFDNLKEGGIAILNSDDSMSKLLIKRIDKGIITYGIEQKADVRAFEIETNLNEATFKVKTPKGLLKIKTRLLGLYNISNILAAIAVGITFNLNLKQMEYSLRDFRGTPGRLEAIDLGQDFFIFVDYAHTDDALRKVLSTLSGFAKSKIITVFGCGGERDKSKRPLMGKVATRLSDFAIITSDNPRSENPISIAKDIESGINPKRANYSIILERGEAIQKALGLAKKDDIVLIAGKGHETEQIIGNRQIKFDDRKVVRELLRKR